MTKAYVIHENPAWLPPLAEAFDRIRLPWAELDLSRGVFDLSAVPPEGVYYNRMSASSHTRGHRYSAELTAAVLAWLTRHGRRVVNGPRALDLEISKVRQYAALEAAGLSVPHTVLVQDDPQVLIETARRHFGEGPVILKPNRGGKGLGVRLFTSPQALADQLAALPDDEAPIDGIWLLQEYIRAPRPVITRAEFVGGRFVYAIEVDTTAGFELCPADVCAIGDAACPVGTQPAPAAAPRFTILPEGSMEPALRERLEGFLSSSGIDVAGVEFIRTADGRALVYDVNTNTNYNAAAEEAAGLAGTARSGPGALAAFLARELAAKELLAA
ncbi:alpha-L-glutamate ligase [Pseudoroseomonas wenyumeiae]|uniref:Alpha-L-glutamate ligase n=1 Tax=Teichococcus wenyumeiae TaxID=2478470 RepID=A0A3A9JG76_9PROT|nr:alpha-L-glutamate ligase [Pseudoroseomonas wenyumeiae]RKK05330.1 alpha-L-glutamate ligase [Pseudoroseomonas wenyumeiae]RMI25533.1 alpha-L-glutamate ligase [Pseudoroseomonas wenyumeiae]